MNRLVCSFLLIVSLVSCATVKPQTLDQRTTVKVVKQDVTKKEAFRRLKIYLSKNLVNSNETIRESDLESGLIVAKFNSDCDAGGLVPSVIKYSLQIDLKKSKTRLSLVSEGTLITPVGYAPSLHPLGYSESYYAKSKACRDSIVEELSSAIVASKSSDDW